VRIKRLSETSHELALFVSTESGSSEEQSFNRNLLQKIEKRLYNNLKRPPRAYAYGPLPIIDRLQVHLKQLHAPLERAEILYWNDDGLTVNFFQQPSHIFTKNLHGTKPFLVFFHIALIQTKPHVPIG